MPFDYETDNRLKALAPVVDEHAEWFSRAVRLIFYPEQRARGMDLKPPESFTAWLNDAAKDVAFSKPLLDELSNRFKSLHAEAGRLVTASYSSKQKPAVEEFDSFLAIYDGFLMGLRRVEHDCALADSGLDVISGLRTPQAMRKDLERELERRARRGKPFCLVLARIDNFDHLLTAVSEQRFREIVGILSRLIKLCLRSFDDAYRLEDGEFVLSLKQSEMAGGSAAVERLRKLVTDENILIMNRGKNQPLTMSYCVAEPLPGDTLDDLLRNMRSDLGRYNETNTALEFQEQSPLQRFIREDGQ